MVFETYIREIP